MAEIRQFDEKKVAEIARNADGSLADRVLRMDRAQSIYSKDARVCRVEGHGRLAVHASGSVLLCCVKHCDHQEFVSQ